MNFIDRVARFFIDPGNSHFSPVKKRVAWAATVVGAITTLGIVQIASALWRKARHITEKNDTQNKIAKIFHRIFNGKKETEPTTPFQQPRNSSTPSTSSQTQVDPEPLQKINVTRAGFQNPGACCFAIAALQCLSSVRDLLPPVEHLVQESSEDAKQFQERKQAAALIISILEKSQQPGTIITQNHLEEIVDKVNEGDRKAGDSKLFTRKLFEVFGIVDIRFTSFSEAQSFESSFPIDFLEENNKLLKKLDNKTCALEYQLAFVNEAKSNYIVFIRGDLPHNPHNRQEKEIPFTLLYENDHSISYELVSAGISLGGHSIAYAKDNQGWQRLDDGSVSREEFHMAEKIIRKDSTILIYRAIPK